jgi:hypothetical protein
MLLVKEDLVLLEKYNQNLTDKLELPKFYKKNQ